MTPEEMSAWQQSHVNDMWRVFRIMAEFVDGFETLSSVGPCVSVFGSARTPEDDGYYRMGVEVGRKLVERGFGVITGGGPGIMEAANRGARDAGGASIGLNIVIPHEQESSPYVDRHHLINFNFFFVRKVMFVKYAQASTFFRGALAPWTSSSKASTSSQPGSQRGFRTVWGWESKPLNPRYVAIPLARLRVKKK